MRRQGANTIPNLEEMLGHHYVGLARNGHNPHPGGIAKPKESLEDILDMYLKIYRRGRDQ